MSCQWEKCEEDFLVKAKDKFWRDVKVQELREDGASGRITRLRLALRVVAEATLSSLVLAIISQTMKQQFCCYFGEDGASGRIRTSDRSVRSRVLYPAELRMHRKS